MTTSQGQVLAPQFASDLVTSITARASGGSEVATFTRATTAYQIDFEGKHNAVLSGEARFQGARRVRNYIATSSEVLDGAAWTTTVTGTGSISISSSSGTGPNGAAITLYRLLASKGTGSAYLKNTTVSGFSNPHISRLSIYVKSNTGVGQNIVVGDNSGNVGFFSVAVPATSWVRAGTVDTCASATSQFLIGTSGAGADANIDILMCYAMLEDATSQANQNPSEYVSVGVLSAPYHGANVDGVQYFNTLNGNTVASNVVTEATGAAIVTGASGVATTAPVDAGGPYGYLAEGARADVLGTTAAIRRTMTDVGWVNTTMTVGAATGTDGVASAAASLTATGANSTSLFTTVLGAAIRTYSAWVRRKTGTGTVNITGDNGATWTAITLTTTYALFQFTTASAANPVVGFRLVTSGDAIEVGWNTLEAATFANPTPIPLNVSKAVDVLTYPTSGNVSGTVGSAYAEWQSSSTDVTSGASPSSLLVNFVTGAQALMYYRFQNNGSVSIYDGTAEIFTSATVALNTETKAATSWGGSVMRAVFGGGTVASGSFDGSMNPGANMAIGSNLDGSGSLYGTVRNVRIYATALSAGQLAAMTST